MKVCFYICFLLFSLNAISQPGDFVKKNDEDKSNKLNTNITVGTQVGTTFNNSYWFTSYIAPQISYKVSKRFTLVSGIGFSNTQLNDATFVTSNYDTYATNGSINSAFGYAGGIYHLSDKLKLSAIYSVNNIMSNALDGQNMNSQIQSGSFGVHYKVNPFLSVDAQISVGNDPFNNYMGAQNSLFNQNNFNSFTRFPFY